MNKNLHLMFYNFSKTGNTELITFERILDMQYLFHVVYIYDHKSYNDIDNESSCNITSK